jgi:hypothetical protein
MTRSRSSNPQCWLSASVTQRTSRREEVRHRCRSETVELLDDEVRTTPVNVLTVDGERYLVAPRGITQWVRNIRVAGQGDLTVGRRVETVVVDEVPDHAKPEILRAYLRRWKWEVGQFFDGVGPDASDEELLAFAAGYPVFRITTAA